jgi:hypothetical protein
MAPPMRTSIALVLALAGCSTPRPEPAPPAPDPVTFELAQPTLLAVAPDHVALGDTVKVFGKDLIDAEHGTLALHLEGSFTDRKGVATRYSGDVPLEYVSPSQARFVFGPSVFFSPSNEVGTFQGSAQLVSTLTAEAVNAEPGDLAISEGLATELVAMPSIYVSQLRAVGAPGGECELVTRGTTGGQNLALGVELIGIEPATEADPITFSFTYEPSEITVAYAADTTYTRWPFWGPSTPNANALVPEAPTTFSISVARGRSLVIDPQHFEQVVEVAPPVVFNQQEARTVKLAGFASPVLAGSRALRSKINLVATRRDGSRYARAITVPVFSPIELPPSAPALVPKEWQSPVLLDFVTGSMPNGSDESYHQNTQDSKTQSISMTWNVSNQQSLGFSVTDSLKVGFGLPGLAEADNSITINAQTQATWTQAFGTDVSRSVTATTDQGSQVSQHVVAGQYGAIYLQWLKLEASTDVIFHGPCGQSGSIGNAVLTSWKGGYLLETSPTTNPAPAAHASPVGPIR